MGLHNRKLIEFDRASAPISETLEQICELSCDPSSNSTYCLSPCSRICPNICHDDDSSLYPPPTSASHSFHPNKLFIASFTLLAVTFFALFCYAFYVKRFKRSGRPQTEQDEFIDEDHGPVIDHPIWYINTVGLPAVVIDSIAVLKYRKGDGVVDGTDCSVCLSEFQEDETLRLLPKCSHAFHISCIDTWLRSHTNCPICRAPIVATGAVQAEGGEPSGSGETRVDIPEENEQERRQSPGVGSGGVERRWASLDFSEASKMGKAVAGSGSSEESNSGGGDLKRVGRSQSLLRFVGSSLQSGPDFLKRSVSCYGEFSLPAESESSSGPSSSASSSSSSSSSSSASPS